MSCPSVHSDAGGLSISTQKRPWPVRQYTETPMACPSVHIDAHRDAHGLPVSTQRRPVACPAVHGDDPWPVRQYTETPVAYPKLSVGCPWMIFVGPWTTIEYVGGRLAQKNRLQRDRRPRIEKDGRGHPRRDEPSSHA